MKYVFGIILLIISQAVMAMTLYSSAVSANKLMPSRYTCTGKNSLPPLAWKGIPANTESFTIIVDDLDASSGVWNHWVVFNLPADMRKIKEGQKHFPKGVVQARNSWKHARYDGPCPAQGLHRYEFTLYALNKRLDLTKKATKADVLAAMQNHILAKTQLVVPYQKY